MDKLSLWWKKAYLWVGLGCVLLVLAILFFRRGGQVTPKEVKALEGLEGAIRTNLAKVDNEAIIEQIKAEAKEQQVKDHVDHINATVKDEFLKAKLLVEIKDSLE